MRISVPLLSCFTLFHSSADLVSAAKARAAAARENRIARISARMLCRRGARGNGFDLLHVINVMSTQGFDDGLKCHGAALGMSYGFSERHRRQAAQQLQIPIAHGCEGGERRSSAAGRVRFGPKVLIKWLDDVVRFGEGLPDAECEHGFAIGKVAEDFADAPLARRRCAVDLLVGKSTDDFLQLTGSCRYDIGGIFFSEEWGVRIHAYKLTDASAGGRDYDRGFNSPRMVGMSSDTVG